MVVGLVILVMLMLLIGGILTLVAIENESGSVLVAATLWFLGGIFLCM